MNSLYNLAGRQSAAIRADIEVYTRDPASSSALRPQITSSISAFVKTIEDYEAIAKRELVVAKREKALNRAASFHAEVKQFRETLARIDAQPKMPTATSSFSTNTTGATARARTAVEPQFVAPTASSFSYPSMGYTSPPMQAGYVAPQQYPSTYAAYPSAMPSVPPADPLAPYRLHQYNASSTPEQPAYSMRESHALREHSFIQNTENQLDAFIAQGRSVLGNLVEQRDILKQTRRRLLDAANSVGLSRELIGVIDRMSTQDTILFFVGAIFTLVMFYLIYRYLG